MNLRWIIDVWYNTHAHLLVKRSALDDDDDDDKDDGEDVEDEDDGMITTTTTSTTMAVITQTPLSIMLMVTQASVMPNI